MSGTYSISAVLLGAIVGIAATLITRFILKSFALKYGREVKDWNALVKLEHLYNTNLQLNYDNSLLLEKMFRSIEKNKLPVFHLRTWEIDTDVTMEIKNIDLKNDVFSLNIELKRMNHFVGVTSALFYDLRKYHLLNQIGQQEFVSAIGSLKKEIENMREYTKFLDGEIQGLLVKVRVLAKERGFMRLILKFFTRSEHYPKGFDAKVKEEMVLLKKEFELVAERRKQKISALDIKE